LLNDTGQGSFLIIREVEKKKKKKVINGEGISKRNYSLRVQFSMIAQKEKCRVQHGVL
jgi:hypothetical protein